MRTDFLIGASTLRRRLGGVRAVVVKGPGSTPAPCPDLRDRFSGDRREPRVRDFTRVSTVEQVEIRRLDAAAAQENLEGLAGVLRDCIEGGASVRYLAPFSVDQAREAFESVRADVERQRRVLLAAFLGGEVVGTVQIGLAQQPNSPHRGEIAQLLVRRSARGRGVAQRLMERAEQEALAEGKTLLVLDTVTGDDAERLYERLGWTKVGVIPEYALYPDGRPCDTTIFYKAL